MTDVKQINDLYIVDDANNTLVVDSANARVGIGVSNPGYPLSVSGAGNFTGNLTVSSIFKVDTAGSQITLGTSTAVPGNAVTIVGNTDIAGTTNTTTLQLGGITLTSTATELNQLSGITLGTAASADTGDFATAAQGALADTALQTAAVDGTTITGDGTVGNPLIANIGGGNTLNDTYYRFETSTALTPGSGKVQFDNATFSSVTEIAFNATNKNGVDIGVILNTFIDASYQVYFQQKDDASKAVLFNITSGATYDAVNDVYKFDVTHLQTTTQMSNGKDCFVLFAYREAAGVSIGDAIGSGTAGSLLFVDASTNLGQDNSNLFWDDTNNRLGLGTTSPTSALDIQSGTNDHAAVFRSTDTTARINFVDNTTSADNSVGIGAAGDTIRLWTNNQIVISGTGSGNVNFNSGRLATYNGATPTDGQLLIGNSVGRFDAATLTAGTNITITNAGGSITIDAAGGVAIGDTITGATQGSVLFAGAAGVLAQDNTNFFWDDTNNRLGIGTATPTFCLDINGSTTNTIGIFRSTDATARVNFVDSSTSSDTHVGIGAVGNAIKLWAGNLVVFEGAQSGNIALPNGKLSEYNGAAPTDGQLLIGSTAGGVWEAATLTAGTNITITNAGGAITIDAAGGGGATPGGNPGDVQVNDGLGGFGAAAALQDIAYLQPGQAETDTFTPILSAPSWGPPGPPATIQDAIDRLASFVAGNLGPIP